MRSDLCECSSSYLKNVAFPWLCELLKIKYNIFLLYLAIFKTETRKISLCMVSTYTRPAGGCWSGSGGGTRTTLTGSPGRDHLETKKETKMICPAKTQRKLSKSVVNLRSKRIVLGLGEFCLGWRRSTFLSLSGLCQKSRSFPHAGGGEAPTIETYTQIHSRNIPISHLEQCNGARHPGRVHKHLSGCS